MQNITNYSYLLEQMFGMNRGRSLPKMTSMTSIPLSSLGSSSVQAQLKAAGIDTNSNQYKTVVRSMMESAGGRMAYTNIQAIKNQMKQYDKDGDYIDPITGLAGLLITDENRASKNRIIDIPESSRDEMFELTKKEFLRENGVANGDTTHRSDVYTHLYKKMQKDDRLAAGHTMEQYERAYTRAFVEAAKAADPTWRVGKPIPEGALEGITRKSVDNSLVQSGSKLVRKKGVGGSLDLQI